MSHHKISPVLKLCAAALVAFGSLAAKAAPLNQTDRLIVKYKDAVDNSKGAVPARAMSAARQALIARAGQQLGATMRALRATATGADVLQLSRTMSLDEARALAAELMARDPDVEYAEPDRIMLPLFVPNDPLYTQQWHYYDPKGGLNLPAAWDKSTGAGVNVAVIDTGYRPHADLSGQILPGYDFITSAAIGADGNGRDSDASDTGDSTTAGQCGGGLPRRTTPRAGTAPTWPARSPPKPTTASAWPASPTAPRSCRCVCWASAAATPRTSPTPSSGLPAAPSPGRRPTPTRRAC
jgi:serine protease